MIWVFASAYSLGPLNKRFKSTSGNERYDDWKNVIIVAWTGTRGVISMATALALPFTLYNGEVFPQRHLIIFICFVVIFVTLVVQGLSLPLLIRLLHVKPSNNEDKEEKQLQLHIANCTLHFIDYEFHPQPKEQIRIALRAKYEQLAGKLAKEIDTHTQNEQEDKQLTVRTLTAMQQAQITIGQFQRDLLLKLHKDGDFGDTAIRQVEREMDIQDLNLSQLLPKEEDKTRGDG
jgi:CPA1 family monovalent cation:H+ antiporter